ncbi:MAG: SPOR domain-containing protein [Gammaproteobacteria bacterium]|nr:SPOR domain-containing protein [Gammaproteobacteria bacterium]
MERQLKERVVGAVLLVLAAVLIIPLFLDGPDPGTGEARPSVALPPAEDTDARTRTVRLEQSRDTPTAPPMGAEAAPEAPDEAAPQPATADPQPQRDGAAASETGRQAPAADAAPPAPAPAPSPAPSPAPTASPPATASPSAAPPATTDGANWVVQLGSFGDRDNAERLAEELRGKRYQSFVTRVDTDGRTLHRVRVGPGGAREEADRLLERLRADGYSGQAVPE